MPNPEVSDRAHIVGRIVFLWDSITSYSPPFSDSDIECIKRDIDSIIRNRDTLKKLNESYVKGKYGK